MEKKKKRRSLYNKGGESSIFCKFKAMGVFSDFWNCVHDDELEEDSVRVRIMNKRKMKIVFLFFIGSLFMSPVILLVSNFCLHFRRMEAIERRAEEVATKRLGRRL